MEHSKGLFIVLEGSDGAGKATQLKLLTERLRAVGHDVDIYDFPRYDQASSYFIKRYLNGDFGPASEISPYTASLFYALDRYEAAPQIRGSLSGGKIVIANRYAGSNMAHQGAKFTNTAEQRGFFMWEDGLEYQLLGIPRPNLNLFLRVPAEVSFELIKQKGARSYTAKTHDEHEADIEHLRQAVSAFGNLCRLFPKDFKVVECAQKSKILPIPEINNKIWAILKPLLPKPARRARPTVVKLSDKRIEEPVASKASAEKNQTITFNDLSLLAITSLETAYGQTLKKEFSWPPDTSKPRLNFFIPPKLPPKLTAKYSSAMEKIAGLHRQMAAKTSDDSPAKVYLADAIPLAALGNARITDVLQNLPSSVPTIVSDLPELRQTASKATLTLPKPLKDIVGQFAEDRLTSPSREQDITLLEARPKNELSLLVDYLYPNSHLSKQAITAELDGWTYEKKAQALKIAVASSTVLEYANYRFDVVSSRRVLISLMKNHRLRNVQVQLPTPVYGYEVPEVLENLGIEGKFIECFDISLELFSEMQSAGCQQSAPYAALMGHKLRWQFSISAADLFTRDRLPAEAAVFINSLRERAAEEHPIMAQSRSRDSGSLRHPSGSGKQKSPVRNK